MPSLLLAVCCTRVLIDTRTNSLSIIDIIEGIKLIKPQTIYGNNIDIVTVWAKDSSQDDSVESFKYRVSLFDPDKSNIIKVMEMENEIPKHRLRSIISLYGIQLKQTGTYNFIIEVLSPDGTWKDVFSIPLDVTHVEMPSGATEII